MTTLIARLHPPVRKEGVRYGGRYIVEFDGDLIVEGSRDPEHDLARALLSRGITGKVTMLDANTGKPRTIIDIERAAHLTMSEESRDGLRRRKCRQSPDSSSSTTEDDIVLPTMPPEANEAA
jgi:hypothetical protein